MNWMSLVFLASVFFVWRHRAARFVLLVTFLTLPVAFLIFRMHPNVELFGIAHFLLWLPLLVFLVRKEIKAPSFNAKTAYGVWLLLLSATIIVSLAFDARDIVLVALGRK